MSSSVATINLILQRIKSSFVFRLEVMSVCLPWDVDFMYRIQLHCGTEVHQELSSFLATLKAWGADSCNLIPCKESGCVWPVVSVTCIMHFPEGPHYEWASTDILTSHHSHTSSLPLTLSSSATLHVPIHLWTIVLSSGPLWSLNTGSCLQFTLFSCHVSAIWSSFKCFK